jgi:hypothetical protein
MGPANSAALSLTTIIDVSHGRLMLHGPWPTELSGVVTLPSGRLVRGRGLKSGPVDDGDAPDFGLYLTAHLHRERWPSQWIRWPDFRLPKVPWDALSALREAYDRSSIERVEIACNGGAG